jgi:hypothetical protein
MVKEYRKVGGDLSFKGEEDVIIVGIQPLEQEKESQSLLYPTDSSSISIAKDSSTFAGLDLQPVELETYRREVDRGRFHGKAGFAIKGFKFEVERKPRKEIETITHTKWRKPQK